MLLSCGDALIDFLPVKSTDGREAIVPVVGGSCLNMAVGMARLGAPTGFVGGLSTDLFGRMNGIPAPFRDRIAAQRGEAP
jgi:fructokinase